MRTRANRETMPAARMLFVDASASGVRLRSAWNSGSCLACHTRSGPRPARATRRGLVWCAAAGGTDDGEEGQKPRDKEKADESATDEVFDRLRAITETESALSNPLGLRMSHELVRFDKDGYASMDRFVYVEEIDCIGCTHCAATANSTFYLQEDFGRARVFNQAGDIPKVVEEAIDTCPVNCIYYVSWEDLVTLEKERRGQSINNWARLVGGQDVSASKTSSKAYINNSGIMRCTDCPHRGCGECPLYGVGENPEYMRKVAVREERKWDADRDDGARRRRL